MSPLELEETLSILRKEIQKIKERIKQIEYKLYINKRYLTIKEVCDYTGYTPSTIYHLTGSRKIRYHKPNGKTILILRKDLEKWIESSPIETLDELKSKPYPLQKKSSNKK